MLKYKIYENPSIGGRVVPCRKTDRHEEAYSRFSQFCGKQPKKEVKSETEK
jgi:hypothetical protein